jgi:aryl-alcohol dehydrogenase-like predicted oxidoreductase
MKSFNDELTLGRSGLRSTRMGIGSDSDIDAGALEWAFERGVNYFYWGTRRTDGMRRAIHSLAPRHRDEMVIALQSYDVTGLAMGTTLRRGLRQLKLDYADVLILGKRDNPVPLRIQEQALALKEAGLVKNLCVSAHDRSTYKAHLASGIYDLIMVRYNCAHTGAETEVFPLLDQMDSRPGVLVYNSTRWGNLFDPAWMPTDERTPAPTHLYRHALSHPAVDMVLTAPQNREQLECNLEALEQGPLSEDECEWLTRIGKHVHAKSPNTNWDFLRPSHSARS